MCVILSGSSCDSLIQYQIMLYFIFIFSPPLCYTFKYDDITFLFSIYTHGKCLTAVDNGNGEGKKLSMYLGLRKKERQ